MHEYQISLWVIICICSILLYVSMNDTITNVTWLYTIPKYEMVYICTREYLFSSNGSELAAPPSRSLSTPMLTWPSAETELIFDMRMILNCFNFQWEWLVYINTKKDKTKPSTKYRQFRHVRRKVIMVLQYLILVTKPASTLGTSI